MLTRLARTASLHAGNLHKALEGLGESQEVESPVTDLSRPDPDLAADAGGLDEKERENLSLSTFESIDLAGIGPPLEAKGWLSPPDSIYSSSTDSGVILAESSLPDSFNDEKQLLHRSSSRDATESQHSSVLSQTASQNILDSPHRSKFTEAENTPIGSFKSTDPNEYPVDSASPSNEFGIVCPDTSRPSNENREMMSRVKDEISSLNQVIIKDEAREAAHASSRVRRGELK